LDAQKVEQFSYHPGIKMVLISGFVCLSNINTFNVLQLVVGGLARLVPVGSQGQGKKLSLI
jgi:hypothetical protein